MKTKLVIITDEPAGKAYSCTSEADGQCISLAFVLKPLITVIAAIKILVTLINFMRQTFFIFLLNVGVSVKFRFLWYSFRFYVSIFYGVRIHHSPLLRVLTQLRRREPVPGSQVVWTGRRKKRGRNRSRRGWPQSLVHFFARPPQFRTSQPIESLEPGVGYDCDSHTEIRFRITCNMKMRKVKFRGK